MCCRVVGNSWRKENHESQSAWRKDWSQKNAARIKEQNKKWVADNIDRVKANTAKWRLLRPELQAKYTRDWRARHPEQYRKGAKESGRKRRKTNLPKIIARNKERKAAQLRAAPVWRNRFFIEEIYDLAARRSRVTEIKWHVDHIVPLKSKFVCGLHVEHNLQVIPAAENLEKKNRYWPDMPEPLEHATV